MNIVGIDPGMYGAIVGGVGNALIVGSIPLITPDGKKQRPEYIAMENLWRSIIEQADHVFIEQVGAMPQQGGASMFNFGYAAGVMYGMVLAHRKRHDFLTPQKWQAVAKVKKDADSGRKRASQLYPLYSSFFTPKGEGGVFVKKVAEGVADATLIRYSGEQLLLQDIKDRL